ncbi:MAG: mechanosensitive ion channel [Flavobacteriales bacterium]|nr:mechanosensitive ion channel [Flavobacteriales bacterium]
MNTIKESFLENLNQVIVEVPNYLIALLIFVIGVISARFIANLSKKTLNIRSKDPLIVNFLSKTIKYAVILLVFILALKVAGLGYIATGLFAAAGASAVILGFAFKDIGENFISGVILAFNRPFDVGDTVSVGDIFGKVKTMEFRYTKLKTFDGKDVYIPNSDIIRKSVFNFTEDGFFRVDFVVGIAYEDNIDFAEEVILTAIRGTEGVIEDEEHEAFTTIDELATSTVNIKAYFWVKTTEYGKRSHRIKSDAISNVKKSIEKEGLSMPADIQEIKLYGSQKEIPVIIKNGKL